MHIQSNNRTSPKPSKTSLSPSSSPLFERKYPDLSNEHFSDYDSDSFVEDRPNNVSTYSRERTLEISRTSLSSNDRSRTRTDRQLSKSFESRTTSNQTFEETDELLTLKWIFAAIAIVVLIWFLYPMNLPPTPEINCVQFKELANEFNQIDLNIWKSLKIGIENVFKKSPPQPTIFLMAYNDPKITQLLMPKILNATAQCLGGKKPITLKGESFATDEMKRDYGEFIHKYRSQLEKEKILFISDLNKTPVETAPAFHSICDTITPLVKQAVIFFTVHLDTNDDYMSHKQVVGLVERELTEKWKNAKSDILNALIARVTDQIFWLPSRA